MLWVIFLKYLESLGIVWIAPGIVDYQASLLATNLIALGFARLKVNCSIAHRFYAWRIIPHSKLNCGELFQIELTQNNW